MRLVVHRITIVVCIATLLNERGRAISDVLRALLSLLLRVTRRDQKAVEPHRQ